MQIRQAIVDDIPWILEELRKFSEFVGTSRHVFGDESHIAVIVKNLISNHVFLVAQTEVERAGFIAGALAPHPFNPSFTVLSEHAWWVSEKHRGSRAGSILLDAFLKEGKRIADWVTISTEAHSPISEKHLLKRGLALLEKTYLLEVE